MKAATPVKIIDTEKPIPVTVEKLMPDKLVTKESKQTLAPNTTEAQDDTAKGQRDINLLWEKTQSEIARVAVYSTLLANVFVITTLILLRNEISQTMVVIVVACLGSMNTTMGIIIGFYYSRTNHQKIGGVAENQSGR